MKASVRTILPPAVRPWVALGWFACLLLPAVAVTKSETTFFRSFEAAEALPLVSPANAPFGVDVAGGPSAATALDAKPGVGFTGLQSLRYRGNAGGRQVIDLYAVDLPVRSATRLSYLIFPCSDAGDLRNPANFVAVDLQFDDGSRMSARGAVDQHRIGASAHAQGEGRILYPDQWNYVSIDLGRMAGGRTVKRILLIHDGPAAHSRVISTTCVSAPRRPPCASVPATSSTPVEAATPMTVSPAATPFPRWRCRTASISGRR